MGENKSKYSCPNCGEKEFTVHHKKGNQTTLFQCNECGNITVEEQWLKPNKDQHNPQVEKITRPLEKDFLLNAGNNSSAQKKIAQENYYTKENRFRDSIEPLSNVYDCAVGGNVDASDSGRLLYQRRNRWWDWWQEILDQSGNKFQLCKNEMGCTAQSVGNSSMLASDKKDPLDPNNPPDATRINVRKVRRDNNPEKRLDNRHDEEEMRNKPGSVAKMTNPFVKKAVYKYEQIDSETKNIVKGAIGQAILKTNPDFPSEALGFVTDNILQNISNTKGEMAIKDIFDNHSNIEYILQNYSQDIGPSMETYINNRQQFSKFNPFVKKAQVSEDFHNKAMQFAPLGIYLAQLGISISEVNNYLEKRFGERVDAEKLYIFVEQAKNNGIKDISKFMDFISNNVNEMNNVGDEYSTFNGINPFAKQSNPFIKKAREYRRSPWGQMMKEKSKSNMVFPEGNQKEYVDSNDAYDNKDSSDALKNKALEDKALKNEKPKSYSDGIPPGGNLYDGQNRYYDYDTVDRKEYRSSPDPRDIIPGHAEWEDQQVDKFYDGWVEDHIENSGGKLIGSNTEKTMNLNDGERNHPPVYPTEAPTERLLENRHQFTDFQTQVANKNVFLTKKAADILKKSEIEYNDFQNTEEDCVDCKKKLQKEFLFHSIPS